MEIDSIVEDSFYHNSLVNLINRNDEYLCETFINFNNLIGTISIEISILKKNNNEKEKVFQQGTFKGNF